MQRLDGPAASTKANLGHFSPLHKAAAFVGNSAGQM